jgi:hypothetical protein
MHGLQFMASSLPQIFISSFLLLVVVFIYLWPVSFGLANSHSSYNNIYALTLVDFYPPVWLLDGRGCSAPTHARVSRATVSGRPGSLLFLAPV